MVDDYIVSQANFFGKYQIVIAPCRSGYKRLYAQWLNASSMALAATLPAPMAEITVAAPVTASPPA